MANFLINNANRL
jgi:PD-(D/E)XK nuclease superfamily